MVSILNKLRLQLNSANEQKCLIDGDCYYVEKLERYTGQLTTLHHKLNENRRWLQRSCFDLLRDRQTLAEYEKCISIIESELASEKPLALTPSKIITKQKCLLLREMLSEVIALSANCDQLHVLLNGISAEKVDVSEEADRLTALQNRLSLLNRGITYYLKVLWTSIAHPDASVKVPSFKEIDEFQIKVASSVGEAPRSSSRRRFVRRVILAALPLQALMILVLGIACLVPHCDQDFTCTVVNNLSRSFQPILHHLDGGAPF
ncbi:unnamed protein product [Soboliphyme baturini]|uniref:KASH domain-containing protein n=1 Tax=Soboliphyme baturini TaxID=241478 RepID=A0A183J9Z0_9BILA|nr:unnamed protein product [Soboliphyme baturini]